MRITYLAAISLDGFIAKEDGDVAWLEQLNIDPAETGLEKFFRDIDGLVMGRKTYDFVFEYGTWPYESKPTWVCTQGEITPLAGANLIVARSVEEVVQQASGRGLKHLWLVGGGQLASACLARGLITHLSISEMPVTLSRGIPLFSDHQLDQIAYLHRSVTQKKGFRQIEMHLKIT